MHNVLTGALTTHVPPKPRLDGRRMPPTPSWWSDDEDASDDNFLAMQEMERSATGV